MARLSRIRDNLPAVALTGSPAGEISGSRQKQQDPGGATLGALFYMMTAEISGKKSVQPAGRTMELHLGKLPVLR